MKKYDYGHLEEIEVRREDQQLYKFREGDFPRLFLQDIEDMLLLLVQQKLTNLTIDERVSQYGRESLTMEDVLATLNSRELKKRTEGIKKETGDRLYVREKLNHSDKAHLGGSLRFKSKGETGKLKCFICHSDGHVKIDCLMKNSSGFVKKGKRDHDSDSFDDEDNAYFGEALVVVENNDMTELVIDSGRSYHITHRRDFLYDFKVVDGGLVQLGDNRTCTIKGTWKVKIQLHNGSSFILDDVKYVLGLRRSLISLGTLEEEGYTVKMQMGRIKHRGSKQVRLKQLGSKKVRFKQLGHKKVGFKQLDPTGIHGVQDEKHVWFEVELQRFFRVPGQEGIECNVVEKKKVKKSMEANLGKLLKVPGQEGAEGNVVEKKKVKKSMEANLGKLLK
ncbi:hypothetical protein Tco_0339808 [Tanacetum coccineum]